MSSFIRTEDVMDAQTHHRSGRRIDISHWWFRNDRYLLLGQCKKRDRMISLMFMTPDRLMEMNILNMEQCAIYFYEDKSPATVFPVFVNICVSRLENKRWLRSPLHHSHIMADTTHICTGRLLHTRIFIWYVKPWMLKWCVWGGS